MSTADLAAAAQDPRLLPRWLFAGFGALLAVALVLVRVHILFLLVAGAGLLLGVLHAQRRGAYDAAEGMGGAVALRTPLPGTTVPALTALGLVLLAAQVIAGTFTPTVPGWAVVLIALVVGALVATLLRRSELMRVAGTRRLEGG